MSYLDTLSAEQKKNAELIVKAAKDSGITNPYSIAAMLSIVSKESSFVPKNENMNYSADRLQVVFKLSPQRAKELAYKPEAIANAVYGGKYGNAPNEGWKYRGRGYNGLTFKGNYKTYSDLIGVDLVSDPEKANDPYIAGRILTEYFKRNIAELNKRGKLKYYNATNINDFKNEKDSTLAFYHANAGVGNSVEYVKALQQKDTLGGMTKALARVGDLLSYVNSTISESVSSAVETAKKKSDNNNDSCVCPNCGNVHTIKGK